MTETKKHSPGIPRKTFWVEKPPFQPILCRRKVQSTAFLETFHSKVTKRKTNQQNKTKHKQTKTTNNPKTKTLMKTLNGGPVLENI